MKKLLFVLLTVLLWGGEAWACPTELPMDLSDASERCRWKAYADSHAYGSVSEKPTLRDGKRIGDVATCLASMEAAMREHDAIDLAERALRDEYIITPSYAYEDVPMANHLCLSLGGSYRCGDEQSWRQELTEYGLKAREEQLKKDREKLALRQAWQTTKDAKEKDLANRKAAFVTQWNQAKEQCWGKP